MAPHGRFNSWYISLPFYLELNAFVAYSAEASFNTDRHNGKFQIIAKLQIKIETHFLLGIVLAVAVVDAEGP